MTSPSSRAGRAARRRRQRRPRQGPGGRRRRRGSARAALRASAHAGAHGRLFVGARVVREGAEREERLGLREGHEDHREGALAHPAAGGPRPVRVGRRGALRALRVARLLAHAEQRLVLHAARELGGRHCRHRTAPNLMCPEALCRPRTGESTTDSAVERHPRGLKRSSPRAAGLSRARSAAPTAMAPAGATLAADSLASAPPGAPPSSRSTAVATARAALSEASFG